MLHQTASNFCYTLRLRIHLQLISMVKVNADELDTKLS